MECLAPKLEDEKEPKVINTVEYDEILSEIGPRGRFQIRVAVLLWLTTSVGTIGVFSFLFTGYEPKYRCPFKPCENYTIAYYYENPAQELLPEFLIDVFGNEGSKSLVKDCRYFIPPSENMECSEYIQAIKNGNLEETTCLNEELIYDKEVVRSSLIFDFDLTCGNAPLRSIFNALYMGGMLIGSFLLGILSDKFGRMFALMTSVILLSLAGSIIVFLESQILFGICRVLAGMGGAGVFIISFVLIMEMTTPDNNVFITTLMKMGLIIGTTIIATEAYFIRDWKLLQLVSHVPILLVTLLWFLIPESPRWLLTHGRVNEARNIINKISIENKSIYPHYFFRYFDDIKDSMIEQEHKKPKHSVIQLFKPKILFCRTLNIFYQWFCVSMAYYGISFSFDKLSGNLYLNVILSAVIEFPAHMFGYFCTDFFGRKFIVFFLQCLCGISCIATGFFIGHEEMSAFQTGFALLGKFASTSTFGIMYVYTGELYPTSIRGTAIGSCSTIARIGGVVTLLLLALRQIWAPLPIYITGIFTFIAGLTVLLVPETTSQALPSNIEEAIHIKGEPGYRKFLSRFLK